MRSRRLLVLGGLIAAALVWLFLALPRERALPSKPVAAAVPSRSTASPPRRMTMRREAQAEAPELAEPPPELPPTVPMAPLQEPSNDAPPAPAPPPIDARRATDLFAALLAKQEADGDEGDVDAKAWQLFREESMDASWAPVLTDEIRRSLRHWIDTLPESVRPHVAIVNVECRTTLCQILIADNGLDTLELRGAMAQDWMHGSDFLRGEPWWNEGGFIGKSMTSWESDGHALIVTYLTRTAAPGGD